MVKYLNFIQHIWKKAELFQNWRCRLENWTFPMLLNLAWKYGWTESLQKRCSIKNTHETIRAEIYASSTWRGSFRIIVNDFYNCKSYIPIWFVKAFLLQLSLKLLFFMFLCFDLCFNTNVRCWLCSYISMKQNSSCSIWLMFKLEVKTSGKYW